MEDSAYEWFLQVSWAFLLLWQLDLTPGDILAYAGPLPWRSAKWTRFQCEAPNCPYVTMLKARRNVLEEKHNEE
jgi:hypothetical protein